MNKIRSIDFVHSTETDRLSHGRTERGVSVQIFKSFESVYVPREKVLLMNVLYFNLITTYLNMFIKKFKLVQSEFHIHF